MIYYTGTEEFDFENLFNYVVSTISFNDVPAKRYSKQSVIGRDSSITFVDGYENRSAFVRLTIKDSPSIQTREFNKREIKRILSKNGYVVFNKSNDIKYKAKVLDAVGVNFSGNYDELIIGFDLEPLAYSVISEDLTWEEANVSWNLADFSWDEEELTETFAAGTHTITNRGNTESKPIYQMSGAGTVTIGSESFTVTEACDVDVEKMIVYSSGVNKIQSFTGDFIELPVGESTITTDVEVRILNKDRWI